MAKQKGAQTKSSSSQKATRMDNKPKAASGSVEGGSSSIDQSVSSVLKMHDTPPPIVIGGGSIVFEMDKEFDEITAGTPKKHIRKPPATSTSVLIGHIKILDGSGEMLYRNLDSETCRVIITLDDDMRINVMGGSTLEIESPRRLELGAGLDKPVSKKRKIRYRHKKSGGVESAIKKVQVVEGADVLFSVLVDTLQSKDDDFRVMLWLHE